ncbi:MAG: HEPN domain-containing protein [Spirochaetales bacterium]|nr:HEPN domain-containing protein [Spirochaetales bacterium]
MEEIKALHDRAKKYLDSAQVLFDEKDFESCVSRIYYAMFFMTEALLLTRNLSFSSHKGVISAFGEHFVKASIFPRDMSKDLSLAFQKRQLSDYEYSFVIQQDEAAEMLEIGNKFVDKIVAYLKDNKNL